MHAVVLNLAAFQTPDVATTSTSDAHLTMIFVGIIAVCVLLLILAMLGAVIGLLTLRKKLEAIVADTTRKATPLIAEATSLFNEVSPHVRKITANVSSISDTVKTKVDQFEGTLTDVNDRTKVQVARVDGMVSDALTKTSDITSTIHRGIRAPIREVAGIFAAVKAAVDVLANRGAATSAPETTYSTRPVTPISPRPEPVTGRVQGL